MWGYGYDDPFWDYGYGDIYAGIFSPYGYDDLAGYWPQSARPSGQRSATDSRRPNRDAGPVGADVRRGQPRHRRPADRSNPAGDSAQRRPTRRARRARQRLGESGAGHQGRLSDPDRADRAGPARRHAAADRGDDIGGRDGSAAAAEILRPPQRRTEGAAERARRGSAQGRSTQRQERLARRKLRRCASRA